jgi:hypothetical protein
MSVVGSVRVQRRHYVCAGCGLGVIPFDDWAGIGTHRLSAGACRMACLAASAWSFDQASKALDELCGLTVSDQTIRRVAGEHGRRAREWIEGDPAAAEPVRRAAGHKELLSDGVQVNTRAGWREMRITVLARRGAGPRVDAAAFTGLEDRALPRPAARLVTARIAGSESVGAAWRREARRVGFDRGEPPSVIADGARWIWAQVDRHLPRAERVVDVYHVSQHLHACGQALHGQGTPEARAWARDRLIDLVRHGPSLLLWDLERQAERWPAPAGRAALLSLAGYVRPNLAALRYADRLGRGLAIGSGQVEGACKTVVGRRLKINSARWHPPMAERMAALCALRYTDLWDTFWGHAAA